MNEPYDPLASVQAAGPPGSISFIYGLPDPETFPAEELRVSFETIFQEKASLALQYGPEQGLGPLIDYLRKKIRRDEGISLDRSQIMLTGGASQALDHLCTMLTRSGDTVLVEAPTYHESIQLFRNHGLRTLQVPVDEEGMDSDALGTSLHSLENQGQKAKLLYVIPSFQNPSGITLSEKRRRSILDIARKFKLLVIEDDVYFDLAYEKLSLPSLFALDTGKQVVRLGSFSKIIAPGLRLGWMTGPVDLISQHINSGLRCMGGGANPLTANAVALYCQKGFLERHIQSIRSLYRKRRDVMLKTLESLMPQSIRWTKPGGGFFIWLELPHPLHSREVAHQAEAEGVLLLPGDPFFAQSPTGQYLRLAFSYVHPEKIKQGIEKLARLVKNYL